MLLIQLTNHNYLSILFTDPRGHMYLGAGAIWMAFGIFVMRKMIDFKI
jgi:tight adherence protein B